MRKSSYYTEQQCPNHTLLSSAKYPTPPALGMHLIEETMLIKLLPHPNTRGITFPFFVIAIREVE